MEGVEIDEGILLSLLTEEVDQAISVDRDERLDVENSTMVDWVESDKERLEVEFRLTEEELLLVLAVESVDLSLRELLDVSVLGELTVLLVLPDTGDWLLTVLLDLELGVDLLLVLGELVLFEREETVPHVDSDRVEFDEVLFVELSVLRVLFVLRELLLLPVLYVLRVDLELFERLNEDELED